MTVSKSLEEGISICCDTVNTLDSEYLHIDEAFMRVVAEDVVSHIDVPGFDRSLMDGYAIGRSDMENLRISGSLNLSVDGTIEAGSIDRRVIRSGKTFQIMTGALLPEGCVAVIKQEEVQIDKDTIVVRGNWREDENIQRAGQELKKGDKILAKGRVLNAESLERIAACGIESILVHKIPRIYVINTGSELLLPGAPIKAGQIYNSNRSLISGKIASIGALPILANSVIQDDLQAIMGEIEKATLISDMVIISGGTGNGIRDLVYEAFKRLKAKVLFKGVGIIPGKTTAAALYKGRLLYSLSGNPHSAGLLFEVLIKPVILRLKGDLFSGLEWFDIELCSSIKRIKDERCLYRGAIIIKQAHVYAQPISRKNNSTRTVSLVLDLKAGQGKTGDIVKAKIY